jgi:hypothetical protein
MTDFSRVLLADSLAWHIFSAAAQEHLLFTRPGEAEAPRAHSSSARQRALALLVLFDKVLVHEFGEGTFRLPDLENDGIVEVIAACEPLSDVRPVRSSWRRGPLSRRGKPPRSLLQTVRIIEEEKPLVVERVVKAPSEFDREVAHALGVTRRAFIEALLDYALALVKGDTATMEQSMLHALPKDFLDEITNEMFAFDVRHDIVSPVNSTLFGFLLAALQIRIGQDLSTRFGVGIASHDYGERLQGASPRNRQRIPPTAAADSFLILRTALAEERGVLPHIEGIRHALALRQDPNLKALKEHLRHLNASLQNGKPDDLVRARQEVSRARKVLQRKRNWDRALNWLTYLSVPVAVAETLVGGLPVVSMTVTVLGASGVVLSQRTQKANEWVLFGL